jgi:ABC-2 type transport system permease protein
MYLAFALSAFQTQLAYRGQVWSRLFGEIIGVVARIAIWIAVYEGLQNVAGITLRDMITYAILSGTILAAWSYASLINTVGREIKTGDVAVFLLKPLSYPFYLLATECGNLAYRTLAVVVPTVIVAALFYGFEPPASLFHGVMFAAYWLLAFLILFLIAAALGLVAFWMMTAFALEWFLQAALLIFSGTFIPLWFFPEGFAAVVSYLPFAWVGYYPAAVYLGKMDEAATWVHLAVGLGWTAALALAVAWLWHRASRRLTVQGG